MIKKDHITLLLILIFFSGIFLRLYNINFDNLWYDEIISFWVSSPEHSFAESFKIHQEIEIAPYTFNLFLKIYFHLVGYDVDNGRYITALFSILTIFTTLFISKKLIENNFYLLPIFLVAFNIFLISYSQELRVYSILIFFGSLSLLFFIKLLDTKTKNFDASCFFISLLIFSLLHLFSLFLISSFILYLLLIYIKKKKSYYLLNLTLSIISLISIFYYSYYILNFSSNLSSNLDVNYSWNKPPDLKFYTNFYFSNFFGSRIMGGIFLVSFILLVIKNFKVFINLEISLVILFAIIFGYSIPIIFGYFFKPILLPRYVSYLLVFIIILISVLINRIPNRKYKNGIVIFLVLVTIGNHFTEQTFQQIYKKRIPSKPEYSKALKFMQTSNFNNYSLKIEKMKSNTATKDAVNNYISHLSKKNNFDLTFQELDEKKETRFWVICLMDINKKHCSLPDKIDNYLILKEKYFNSINLKLVQVP